MASYVTCPRCNEKMTNVGGTHGVMVIINCGHLICPTCIQTLLENGATANCSSCGELFELAETSDARIELDILTELEAELANLNKRIGCVNGEIYIAEEELKQKQG